MNQDLLRIKGILYPSTGLTPTSGQGGLAWCFRYRQDSYELYDQLYKEIENSGLENVLISSEGFLEPGVFEDLVFRYLSKEIFDVTVIVYVRRQDTFFESAYKQAIEGGGRCCTIDKYKCRLDLLEIVEPWANYYGDDKVIVRPYEKQQFIGNSLFTDFLSNLRVDDISQFKIPGNRVNPTLSNDAIPLVLAVNRKRLPEIVRHRIISRLVSSIPKSENEPPLLSPQERLNLVEHYEETNKIVARRFLDRDDGRLFYDQLPDLNDRWHQNEGLDTNKAVSLLLDATLDEITCAADLSQMTNIQRKQIIDLQNELDRKKSELEAIQSSTFFKLIKPLRWITSKNEKSWG